jgi:endonuclease YncB( thermonuclease family)
VRTLISGLALTALLAGGGAAEIVGAARIIDGDTLAIRGLTLRLHGADAPESAQSCGGADGADWACGAAAAARLTELAGAGGLSCEALDRDAYGRVIARCSAGGRDLAATLVAEGLAWAYVRYSSDYTGEEADARAALRGVWQGVSEAAWDWRRSDGFRAASGAAPAPAPVEAVPADAPSGCAIKGNVNAKGERIYHTPASPWYARVRMARTPGQRWFCDEAEALTAGWRAAGGARP